MIRKNSPHPTAPTDGKSAKPRVSVAVIVIVGLVVVLALVFIRKTGFGGRPGGELAVSDLVKRVSKHILVKTDEEPTVATIQEPDELRLKNPSFYANAKAGDRLLIWSDKAVLYSESQDLILAVLPIDILTQLQQQPQQPQPAQVVPSENTAATTTEQAMEEKATVEVRNGSTTPGLAKNMADKLVAAGFDTLKPRDAGKKGYEKTIIVKISDQPLTTTLAKLVELTKAEIVELPASETNVKGDVLVIVGDDYTP